jgi:hypothetical protein
LTLESLFSVSHNSAWKSWTRQTLVGNSTYAIWRNCMVV